MNKRSMVLIGIVAAAALARLVPHPPNVTPIAAMALFGGACFTNRKMAYLLPLAAMLLSDVVLGIHALWRVDIACQPAGRLCLHPGHDGDRAAHRGSAFGVAGGRGHVDGGASCSTW